VPWGPALRDLVSLRHRSARFRLTALYCSLFFPSAIVLVAVTYFLIVLFRLPVDRATNRLAIRTYVRGRLITVRPLLHQDIANRVADHAELNIAGPIIGHVILGPSEFLVGSCIVLVAMIGVSVLFGWFAAGRVLRPLRVMTSTTRQISERNLHERLALRGPEDELKALADTIDGLLARLEAAFDSQQRFVANASHELRTPLMLSQTLLQVALADPDITLGSLRSACQEAIDAGKDQAQIIDALLTLARSQRGLDHRGAVDLKGVVADALEAHRPSARARGLRIDAVLDDATVAGDSRLLYRLVSNLLDNAIRYNVVGGHVEVGLIGGTWGARLTIANTGLPVPPGQVDRLVEPFRRATPERTANPDGLGLGLSIVADIAKAHGAGLQLGTRPEGGLNVTVSFAAGF
jgi:signal transduction histidine kinase